MTFIRNMDPRDSMEIGRKKDAIEIKEISFTLSGCHVELKNPQEIIEFLKKFQNLDFPKDLVFAPHNIVLKKEEIVDDYSMDLARALAAQKSGFIPPYKEPIPKKIILKEIRLYEYDGKTILYCGKFFEIPSIAQIVEKINYLKDDEERYLKKKEEDEEKRYKEMSAMMDIYKKKQAMKERELEIEKQFQEETKKLLEKRPFIMKKTDAIIKLVNGLL